MADNSDQQHMRRMTLDYSYEQLNGLLTTLTMDKERSEKEAERTTDPKRALVYRMMAAWTGEHIDALQAAWEGGEPLEERAESRGISIEIADAGTSYVFSKDGETHVSYEMPEGDGSKQ